LFTSSNRHELDGVKSSIVTLTNSVGGEERSAAASDILASIKRDSDSDFARVHNVLTEGKRLDQKCAHPLRSVIYCDVLPPSPSHNDLL
jgi:hypothetical protein